MLRLSRTLSNVFRAHVTRLASSPQGKQVQVPIPACSSAFSSMPPETDNEGFGGDLTIGEQKLITKLKDAFPSATHIQVSDVSGGCGAMYQISIETPEFVGKRKIQQHQIVNKVLEEEIKLMHGLQLNTQPPQDT